MAIAIDATSNGNSATSSCTVAHTCTGTNLALWVAIAGDWSDLVTGVTYNSVAMSPVDKAIIAFGKATYLYALSAPATGTHDIVVSSSGANAVEVNAASYTGAHQTTATLIDSHAQATANPTITLACATTVIAANCWLVGSGWADGNGTLTAGAGTFRRSQVNIKAALFDSNATVGTGSQSLEQTTVNQNNFQLLTVASMAPAAAAGGPDLAAVVGPPMGRGQSPLSA